MYKSALALTAIGVLALCLAGCSGTDGTAPATGLTAEKSSPTSIYWPLKLNNEWVYRYLTYTAPDASVLRLMELSPELQPAGVASCATWLSRLISKVPDETGLQWFRLRTTESGEPAQYADYRHTTGGMLCRAHIASTITEPYYLIKAPLTVGHIWNMRLNIFRRIMSTTATVTTPYGTITNCLYIKQTYNDAALRNFIVKYWYARNIGLVKWEIWDDGVLTNRCELKRHNLPL